MYRYICEYCGKDYIPKRRGIQKFCSASCRSRNHQIKQKTGKTEIESKETSISDQTYIQPGINLPNIGNSAIGAVAGVAVYDGLKRFLTSPENKPVTKKDLNDLFQRLEERYHPVHNAPKRNDGTYAFYDKQTKEVKYLKAKW